MDQQAARRFRPALDGPAVLSIIEQWPGLRREHKELWPLLCKRCPDDGRGFSCSPDELVKDLREWRGKPVSESQIFRRLRTLQQRGLLKWFRRGGLLCVFLRDPRLVDRVPLPPRREPRAVPGPSQAQRGLFVESPKLSVFGSEPIEQDAPPEVEPVAVVPPEVEPVAVVPPVEMRAAEPAPPEQSAEAIARRAMGERVGNPSPPNTKEKRISIANPPKNQRPKNQEPKPRARDPRNPPLLGEILPDALNAACDRFTRETGAAACMARMVTRILNVVPELRPTGVLYAEWVARLVFLENKLHEGHVSRLLSDVDAMRTAGTIRTNAGGLFNALLQKLVEKEGIPWNPTGKQTG